jgi:hypothetical protein
VARIRTIKPEFWTSDQIVECSFDTRLLFIGIWNFADDGGIAPHANKSLKMKIFPGEQFTSTDIQRMIDELAANELIQLFEVEYAQYIRVRGWKHQKIDRPSFKFPQPCGLIPRDKNDFLEMCSTNDRRALAPGMEGKGKEGRGEERILNNKQPIAQARAGELARFGIDRFEPCAGDLEYCESLELSQPMEAITTLFDIHHRGAGTLADENRWSKLFRGWVEKNRLPPVRGE